MERVCGALEAAGCYQKRSGGDWTCPAHEDSTPSLSVNQGDKGVVIHCQAGCHTDDVLRQIGLKQSELFDEPARRDDKPRIVATYPYVDETGELLFEAVRYNPKGFRQRRPDGRGGWIGSLGKTRRVIYRLPEVLAVTTEGTGDIYVAEGEKDVEALERAGVVATCNPMGAEKWLDEYSTFLVGANEVIIIADKDDAGYRHARQVSDSLKRAFVPYRIFEAAAGFKDAAQHLGAGLRLDEFVPCDPAAKITPAEQHRRARKKVDDETAESLERELTLTLASDIPMERPHWLWGGYVPIGEFTLIGGRESAGKSSVAYDLTASVTTGKLPGEFHGQPRMVVVVATEDSWAHTIVPRLAVAGADLSLVGRIDVVTTGIRQEISLPDDLGRLEQLIVYNRVALVLLDPLLSRLNARLDTHKDAEVRQALEPLARIAHDTRVALTGIIHVNKGSSQDVMRALMGSTAFGAVARSVLYVMRDPEDETGSTRLCGHAKNNLGVLAKTLRFGIADTKAGDTPDDGPVYAGKVVWKGEDPRSVAEAVLSVSEDPDVRTETAEAILWLTDYLTHCGGVSHSNKVKQEAKSAGFTVGTLQRARQRMKVQVERTPTSPPQTYWRLSVTELAS